MGETRHEGSSSSNEGHEGDEEEGSHEACHEGSSSNEGHEGDEEEGCYEACHEGSSSSSSHEGHEGHEGNEVKNIIIHMASGFYVRAVLTCDRSSHNAMDV